MNDTAPTPDNVLVAMDGNRAFVRIIGRGSFKVSTSLKQFGEAAIQRDIDEVVLDMSECIGMDSTFMGVVAGLSVRMRKQNGGRVYMIHLTRKTRALLSTLGLDQVVEVVEGESGQSAPGGMLQPLDNPYETRVDTTRTMLDAHEELVRMNPENLPRFKDVLTYLREDLKRVREDQQNST